MVFATGCSPGLYRNWADRDVTKLIRDRQSKTLGYQTSTINPVDATTKPSARSTGRSYAKIPVTEIPSVDFQPVRRTFAILRREALGPPEELPENTALQNVAEMDEGSNVALVRTMAKDQLSFGPEAVGADVVPLGLFESIAYAVENSRNYQDQTESLYFAALNVTLERHLFSPRPTAGVGVRFNGGQASTDFRAAATVTADAGVRQRLPTGGQVEAGLLVDFVNALNSNVVSGENATATLTATIPILRGAGFVNLEGLIQSERDLVYAVRSFEVFRRTFAVAVASDYFRLIARQQQVRNRALRYNSLIELTSRTRALFAAGRITALEVQRAEQELLQAEDEVNTAVESFQTELDRFKLLIGMPVAQAVRVVGVAVEVDDTSLGRPDIQETASRYRLELQTARDRIEDSRRNVENAKNGLLPNLDFTARGQINNPSGEPAGALNSETLTYNAGIRLDLPIDRLPERNVYRRALIFLTRAIRDVDDQEENVSAEVRRALRGIRAARATLQLQAKGIEIARQRLENANESLLTGRTTDSRNVVEAQSSLLLAQDRFDSARTNLQIQFLQFLRDTGMLRLDPNSSELGQVMRGV